MDAKTQKRNWPAYDQAQTQEKMLFLQILSEAVDSLRIPYVYGGNGRPSLEISDMMKICCLKVFNTFSLRRTIPDLHLAKALGYITAVPHYKSVGNYFNHGDMSPWFEKLYRLLAMPFRNLERYFAIDSTGFGGYNTIWLSSKYKRGKMQSFNKLHLIVGTRTGVAAVAKITQATDHDVLSFSGMLRSASERFTVEEIYGDKAYLSLYNLNAARAVGATPYILPKKNTKLYARKRWVNSEAWDSMVTLWREHEAEFLRHYGLRNNVEASFSAMKRKFLSYIRSKNPVAQRNEILAKVCVYNASLLVYGIFELGLFPNFRELVG